MHYSKIYTLAAGSEIHPALIVLHDTFDGGFSPECGTCSILRRPFSNMRLIYRSYHSAPSTSTNKALISLVSYWAKVLSLR
jgi:hypothetical protein